MSRLPEGEFSAGGFADRYKARLILEDQLKDVDPNLDSLRNVNDPASSALGLWVWSRDTLRVFPGRCTVRACGGRHGLWWTLAAKTRPLVLRPPRGAAATQQ